jgi:hypothetical protein
MLRLDGSPHHRLNHLKCLEFLGCVNVTQTQVVDRLKTIVHTDFVQCAALVPWAEPVGAYPTGVDLSCESHFIGRYLARASFPLTINFNTEDAMKMPKLSSGISRFVDHPALRVTNMHTAILPAAAWQGRGHVTCGDGVTTLITDFCGSTPSDGRSLACARGEAICRNRGGVRRCDGIIIPFSSCRGGGVAH